MIHSMPCRNPCRLYIHLAFTYSVNPSSLVWSSELRPAPPFPPMRVLEMKCNSHGPSVLCVKWPLHWIPCEVFEEVLRIGTVKGFHATRLWISQADLQVWHRANQVWDTNCSPCLFLEVGHWFALPFHSVFRLKFLSSKWSYNVWRFSLGFSCFPVLVDLLTLTWFTKPSTLADPGDYFGFPWQWQASEYLCICPRNAH
jgi:hypothetical protein